MSDKMKLCWYKGLDEQEKGDITSSYLSSGLVRKRLKEILADKINTASNSSLNPDWYDKPNWSEKHADNVGYRRALRDIISLL